MKVVTVVQLVGVLCCLTGCGSGGKPVSVNENKTQRGDFFEYKGNLLPDPQAARDVEEGRLLTAVASWWGFDEENSTNFLQRAISSGARKLIVPDMGVPWQVDRLYLESDQEIVFESGAVIMARKGSFMNRGDTLFEANNKKNISLLGYGAVFEMRKEDYIKPPYPKSQWRNTLTIKSSSNIKIYGLTMRKSGGDGIYIGRSKEEESDFYCENIHIKDVTLDDHHRQGISVISARNLVIENTTITHTGGTPPQAGIDFEPNNSKEKLERCIVRNCTITANSGPGILFYLGNLDQNSAPISVGIESSRIVRNIIAVWVGGVKDNPQGNIYFGGNRLGLLRYVKRSQKLTVEISRDTRPQLHPVALAGGPYMLLQGESIHLNGNRSYDTDALNGITHWIWDLDGDGEFEDASGPEPEVSWAYLTKDLGLSPNAQHSIFLKVMDDDNDWSAPSEAVLRMYAN